MADVTYRRLYTEQDLFNAYATGYAQGFVRPFPLKTQEDVNLLLEKFREWLKTQQPYQEVEG